ncbi:hypothetical protein H696_03983 [Fonticula alba]|uniref:FYVE-type domain-containing protein n=1 Tax=Fonticula alba TaxID=691883 RepID=A0A058Z629_FONAL|nr:hypothetical protein H696_03983 [Fonticula alba]KCV69561.1 hypothetical protein H696_03983 [Fonticula alba]|eukprot:XP_009496126.1 hypothetical protein H696_03983 [Fonticula alba]
MPVASATLDQVWSLPDIKTGRGRGRALIKFFLMEGQLDAYILTLLRDQNYCSDFYYPGAIFLSPECSQQLVRTLDKALSALHFSLFVKNTDTSLEDEFRGIFKVCIRASTIQKADAVHLESACSWCLLQRTVHILSSTNFKGVDHVYMCKSCDRSTTFCSTQCGAMARLQPKPFESSPGILTLATNQLVPNNQCAVCRNDVLSWGLLSETGMPPDPAAGQPLLTEAIHPDSESQPTIADENLYLQLLCRGLEAAFLMNFKGSLESFFRAFTYDRFLKGLEKLPPPKKPVSQPQQIAARAPAAVPNHLSSLGRSGSVRSIDTGAGMSRTPVMRHPHELVDSDLVVPMLSFSVTPGHETSFMLSSESLALEGSHSQATSLAGDTGTPLSSSLPLSVVASSSLVDDGGLAIAVDRAPKKGTKKRRKKRTPTTSDSLPPLPGSLPADSSVPLARASVSTVSPSQRTSILTGGTIISQVDEILLKYAGASEPEAAGSAPVTMPIAMPGAPQAGAPATGASSFTGPTSVGDSRSGTTGSATTPTRRGILSATVVPAPGEPMARSADSTFGVSPLSSVESSGAGVAPVPESSPDSPALLVSLDGTTVADCEAASLAAGSRPPSSVMVATIGSPLSPSSSDAGSPSAVLVSAMGPCPTAGIDAVDDDEGNADGNSAEEDDDEGDAAEEEEDDDEDEDDEDYALGSSSDSDSSIDMISSSPVLVFVPATVVSAPRPAPSAQLAQLSTGSQLSSALARADPANGAVFSAQQTHPHRSIFSSVSPLAGSLAANLADQVISRSLSFTGDRAARKLTDKDVSRAHWIPDNAPEAATCRVAYCHKRFSLKHRRHHCRVCGLTVCTDHSTKRLPLDRQARYDLVHGVNCRVCDVCFSDAKSLSRQRQTSELGDELPSSALAIPVSNQLVSWQKADFGRLSLSVFGPEYVMNRLLSFARMPNCAVCGSTVSVSSIVSLVQQLLGATGLTEFQKRLRLKGGPTRDSSTGLAVSLETNGLEPPSGTSRASFTGGGLSSSGSGPGGQPPAATISKKQFTMVASFCHATGMVFCEQCMLPADVTPCLPGPALLHWDFQGQPVSKHIVHLLEALHGFLVADDLPDLPSLVELSTPAGGELLRLAPAGFGQNFQKYNVAECFIANDECPETGMIYTSRCSLLDVVRPVRLAVLIRTRLQRLLARIHDCPERATNPLLDRLIDSPLSPRLDQPATLFTLAELVYLNRGQLLDLLRAITLKAHLHVVDCHHCSVVVGETCPRCSQPLPDIYFPQADGDGCFRLANTRDHDPDQPASQEDAEMASFLDTASQDFTDVLLQFDRPPFHTSPGPSPSPLMADGSSASPTDYRPAAWRSVTSLLSKKKRHDSMAGSPPTRTSLSESSRPSDSLAISDDASDRWHYIDAEEWADLPEVLQSLMEKTHRSAVTCPGLCRRMMHSECYDGRLGSFIAPASPSGARRAGGSSRGGSSVLPTLTTLQVSSMVYSAMQYASRINPGHDARTSRLEIIDYLSSSSLARKAGSPKHRGIASFLNAPVPGCQSCSMIASMLEMMPDQ